MSPPGRSREPSASPRAHPPAAAGPRLLHLPAGAHSWRPLLASCRGAGCPFWGWAVGVGACSAPPRSGVQWELGAPPPAVFPLLTSACQSVMSLALRTLEGSLANPFLLSWRGLGRLFLSQRHEAGSGPGRWGWFVISQLQTKPPGGPVCGGYGSRCSGQGGGGRMRVSSGHVHMGGVCVAHLSPNRKRPLSIPLISKVRPEHRTSNKPQYSLWPPESHTLLGGGRGGVTSNPLLRVIYIIT